MKRISSLAILPFIVAVGACSSSNGAQGQPATNDAGTTDGGTTNTDGGTGGGDDSSASGDDGGTSATEFDAVLVGAQVAPAAVLTSAKGTAKFMLQPDGQTLTYDITQNVMNPSSVALHIGAVGVNGSVTHQLTPISGHMTGSVTLTSDEQTALPLDQIYVDVLSQANPGGELRGQLTPPGAEIFVAHATGAQEIPPVTSAYKGLGGFVMTWDPSSNTGTLTYHIETTAVPTDVRLHRAIGGMPGPVAYDLQPTSAAMDGTQTLMGSDNTDVENGHFYLNIVTAANQAGELRGQVIPVGGTLFTGVLAGNNEVPPVASQANGAAQFILSADQTKLSYEAIVNSIIPTGAELDNAAAGMNGPTLYPLTLAQQEVLGSTNVTNGDVQKMTAGAVYVNIKTASYANGELRAQLAPQ